VSVPPVVVVAGPAGAGKSTLGRELARRTGGVLLDLDTLTNPLLDRLEVGSPGHWNDPSMRELMSPARYAVLLAMAREQTDLGLDLVLVAPFTAELAGGPEWDQLCAAVTPAEPRVVWLQVSPDLQEARKRERADPRDAWSVPSTPAAPVVSHVAVDATLPTDAQVDLVLGSFATD